MRSHVTAKNEPIAQEEPASMVAAQSDANANENVGEVVTNPVQISDAPVTPDASNNKPEEVFQNCWHQLFEELFANNPMIYHPLKDQMPALEDGIIKIEVLNDFQKDQMEMRKRAVLEYWRNHFSTNVDDLEITTNEHIEVKKIIYSSDDKLANMQEQNPALLSFLNELNFRIRD